MECEAGAGPAAKRRAVEGPEQRRMQRAQDKLNRADLLEAQAIVMREQACAILTPHIDEDDREAINVFNDSLIRQISLISGIKGVDYIRVCPDEIDAYAHAVTSCRAGLPGRSPAHVKYREIDIRGPLLSIKLSDNKGVLSIWGRADGNTKWHPARLCMQVTLYYPEPEGGPPVFTTLCGLETDVMRPREVGDMCAAPSIVSIRSVMDPVKKKLFEVCSPQTFDEIFKALTAIVRGAAWERPPVAHLAFIIDCYMGQLRMMCSGAHEDTPHTPLAARETGS